MTRVWILGLFLVCGLSLLQTPVAADSGCAAAYQRCLDGGGSPAACAAARDRCEGGAAGGGSHFHSYHHTVPAGAPDAADVSPPSPAASAAPAAPAAPPAPGQPTPAPAASLRPVRAFMRAADVPPPTVGAYGLVAFRAKPTSATRARLLMACTAFIASLPRQQDLAGIVPVSEQMVTIWPVDDPAAKQVVADDCDFLIDHYDLYGGVSAIEDAGRQGAALEGQGPYLIGWSPSNTRGVPDKIVLVVDLSSFQSQDSFNSAFLFWQKKIVEDPQLWRRGFAIERIRLALRDFVDHYGEDILSAVKIFGAKD